MQTLEKAAPSLGFNQKWHLAKNESFSYEYMKQWFTPIFNFIYRLATHPCEKVLNNEHFIEESI